MLHAKHKASETLDVAQWERTYRVLTEFLSKEQKQFKIPLGGQMRSFLKRGKSLAGKILKKLGLRK